MNDSCPKRALLAALGCEPEFSHLRNLPALSSQGGRNLLRWLDRGGLALALLRRLQNHKAEPQISEAWLHILEQRQARNLDRTRDMLEEARRVNAALRLFDVTAAFLKGFTLSPDFCDDPALRHQTDFDILVPPGSVHRAADALRSCGYSTPFLSESGETCFLTPLEHIPSANADLYDIQRQRQDDLQTSVEDSCSWLPVETPQDCLAHAHPQNICGVEFLSLSLEDKFLVQVLHAFRHSFRSWIRLSWLLEIACCMEKRRENSALWHRVTRRAGPTRLTKSIFAFVLGLTNRLFHTPVPSVLSSWASEAMTLPLRAWLEHFAIDWAISDWPGSLNNLFLTAEFIPDPSLRRQYWRSRLLPEKRHASLGAVTTTSPRKFLQLQAARLSYVAHRAVAHLKEIAALPRQQLRWKRALESSGRPGFGSIC